MEMCLSFKETIGLVSNGIVNFIIILIFLVDQIKYYENKIKQK